MFFRRPGLVCLVLVVLSGRTGLTADDPPGGRLLIIGGGTRRTSEDIFTRFIEGAGGATRARVGILPTASRSLEGSKRIASSLVRFGLSPDQIEILDLTPFNAAQKADDPQLVEQVGQCSGLFIAGGDQRRVTAALYRPDGSESPVLKALRDVYRHGGIIAGSSAGAAVQSELMLAVAGLAPDAVDEGFDALDFGLSDFAARRGLHVSRGLGFFRGGIVDQHFSQYRGRLGRLARAATELNARLGVGIDENTAIDVGPDGAFDVIGAGTVTIIDATQAECVDGPLGCRLLNVSVSALQQGDGFQPQDREFEIHRDKHEIQPGQEDNNGHHLIPDIAGEGAVNLALFTGLSENTRRRQVGVMLKHTRQFAHGYRFVFAKTEATKCYGGYVRDEYGHAILHVRLDVEPVVNGLIPARDGVPNDLTGHAALRELQAAWFRGWLRADPANRFRPGDPITSSELAEALAQLVPLEPPRAPLPRIKNISDTDPRYEELEKVIHAGLFALTDDDQFPELVSLPRREVAAILVRACELYRAVKLPAGDVEIADVADETPAARAAMATAVRAGLLELTEQRFRPADPVSREQVAVALCRIVEFPWMR